MHEKMSREQYLQSVRNKIVETAQAMLNGDIDYLIGARRLASLRHDASVKDDDEDFTVFVAIASETDDFPLGSVRARWDRQALDRLQPEIDAAEAWARKRAELVCQNLIKRFC